MSGTSGQTYLADGQTAQPDNDIGVGAVIDQIGVARIADELGISEQAVRRWRQKGQIPDNRTDDVQRLLNQQPDRIFAVEQIAQVSKPDDVVSVAGDCATKKVAGKGAAETTSPSFPEQAFVQPTLSQMNNRDAAMSVELMIAARGVNQARYVVDKAEANAGGLPPTFPVRGYGLRLATLFALDFPILTMAFVSVTEASPVVAAGSAIALSLGLVLCAHAAGAQLRALATHIPEWLRGLSTLVLMISLIAAVIGVAAELRLKGYELDALSLGDAQVSLFDGPASLPEAFTSAIVRAAGLVTFLLTVFGISWSYQNHGPQRHFALAEKAYRYALRRYAGAVKRSHKKSLPTALCTAAAILFLASNDPAHASNCDGDTVLALVDTTTAYDDRDRRLLMPAIDEMVRSIVPGTRFVIRTVRDAPASSRLLLDVCAPATPTHEWSLQGVLTWLSSSPGKVRMAEASFHQAIREALLPELTQNGEAPGTALIDTLAHFVSIDEPTAIWLFSDLLESVAISTSSLLASSDSLITLGIDMATPGISVHVAGVGHFHDQERRPLTSGEFGVLIDSWVGLIRQSGGELHLINQSKSISSVTGK